MSNRSRFPSYRLHKQSGQVVVTLRDRLGNRRDVLLGKYGSPESRAEYTRVLAEWEGTGRRLPVPAVQADLTINELILAYWRHVEQSYRRHDGTPSRTQDNIKIALRPLRELYGHTAARDFGPKSLKAVQQRMVDVGLCRSTINCRVGRIKSMFRWAESEELITPSSLHALQTVRGLSKGRTAARETEPVRPVEAIAVATILPFLMATVADMARLQQLTGMRSGELVIMRGIDLDMGGPVWLYRPGSDHGAVGTHKTAHHGHQRVIAIGPRGQEIVRKYLKTDLLGYLFSPKESVEAYRASVRANRKTKLTPSQQKRRKSKPTTRAGDRYAVHSYRQAIERACKRAGVPHWHPHQLRHTIATEIRREAGLDAARAVLGHRSPVVTEVYAELDMSKAAEVMERLG